MRLDCQLRALNAEVTGSLTMVLLPYSHSCPPMLVPLLRDDGEGYGGWRTALSSQGTSSPRTWCSSAISPSSFGPSLIILGRFSPRLGPWAYHSKWVGVLRSFGPTVLIISRKMNSYIDYAWVLTTKHSWYMVALICKNVPIGV